MRLSAFRIVILIQVLGICMPSFGWAKSCEENLLNYAAKGGQLLTVKESTRVVTILGDYDTSLKAMRVFDARIPSGLNVVIVPPKDSGFERSAVASVATRISAELKSIFTFYDGLGQNLGSATAEECEFVLDLHASETNPRAHADLDKIEIRANFIGDYPKRIPFKFIEVLAHESAHLVLAHWLPDSNDDMIRLIHEVFADYLTWLFMAKSEQFLASCKQGRSVELGQDEHAQAYPVFLELVNLSKNSDTAVLLGRTAAYLRHVAAAKPTAYDELVRDVKARF